MTSTVTFALANSKQTILDNYKPKGRTTTKLAFGLPLKDDGKGGKILSGPNGELDPLQVFRLYNPNALENILEKEENTRSVFEKSLEKPLEFIKEKNELRSGFREIALSIRNQIIELIGQNLPFYQAEQVSGNVAKGLYSILTDVLENDIMPSTLEKEIVNRRIGIATAALSNPLTKKVDDKIGEKL